jgi:CheY-like chemotaxis protein
VDPTDRTILICDDEPHVTQLMGLTLGDAGFRVREAADGREALDLALAEPPDLVITDFQMPRMNGLELARHLRSRPETTRVPVIMLTSRSHRIDADELAATAILRVLPKPFSPRDVAAEATRLLRPDALAEAA